MSHEPEDFKFSTSEQLLAYLREKVDDIESVVIPVQGIVDIRDAHGRLQRSVRGIGASIKLCEGNSLHIHRKDAEMLINDGILQRLKIKCVLDTLEK